MIYELRHYVPVPGKEAALMDRFKNHTFAIFEKAGLKVVDYWVADDGSGHIWYVMEWESVQAMKEAWDRFRKDRDWIAVKEATERSGPLVQKIETVVLRRPEYVVPAYR